MKYWILMCVSAIGLWASAHPVDSLLSEVERNNLQLQQMRVQQEADLLQTKAENNLGETSVDYSPFFASGVSGVASSELVVAQSFDFPTLYAARNKSARLQQKTSALRYDALRSDVLFEAENLCFDLIHLNRQISLISERIAFAQKLVRSYEEKQLEGEATKLEIGKVKLELVDLQVELGKLEADRANALAALKVLNGGKEADVRALSYPTLPSDAEVAAWVQQAAASDPNVQAAHAQLSVSEQEVKISKQNYLPKFNVGYRRNTAGSEASNGFLVGVSIPLFSQRHTAKKARLQHETNRLALENARQQTEAEVQTTYQNFLLMQRTLKTYQPALLSDMLEALGEAFDAQQLSLIDYLRETDAVYASMADYNELERNYRKVLCQLLKNKR